MKLQEIITDAEIDRVHARANFGSMSNRDVVNEGVLNVSKGYHCGYTQQCIIIEHGLAWPLKMMSPKTLKPKGERYLAALNAVNKVDERGYDLEERARVVATCFFDFQEKSELSIGGIYSKYRMNEVFEAAFHWLIKKGYITKTAFGAHNPGRYIYRGTGKLSDLKRASLQTISEHDFPLAFKNEARA